MRGYVDAPAPHRDRAWLDHALDHGRLVVHYQPIVALPGGDVIGLEALARLRDTDGTLLAPAHFVPLAERVDRIGAVDLAVLDQALDAVACWRNGAGRDDLYVSVNVAPSSLAAADLPDRVAAALHSRGLPASALLLEVVESELIGDQAPPRATVEALSGLGVRIALDDFGTGFATLENLHRLPVSVLKIDRVFVRNVVTDPTDAAIVRAVLDLADALELTVVAEGVETEAQAEKLAAWGCPAAQGWLFGRPQAVETVGDLLRATPARTAVAAPLIRWSPSARATAVAFARVLAASDPDRGGGRALAHAVAARLGRELRLPRGAGEDAAVLALLADTGPLLPDDAAGQRLLDQVPGLRELRTRPSGDAAALPLQVRVAAAAAAVAAATHSDRMDPRLHALRAADVLAADDPLAEALTTVGSGPPLTGTPGLERILDTLTVRSVARESGESRLRALAALADGIATVGSYREVVALAAEEARRTLGAASVSIGRHDASTEQVTILCNVGHLGPGEERLPAQEVYDFGTFPLSARLLGVGLPHIQTLDDEGSDPGERELLRQLGKGSMALAPIRVADRKWGELYATTLLGAPPFAPGDVDIIMAAAALIGAAVTHAERLERISRLAFEDPLTSLANRRALDDALAAALGAPGDGAALVVVDVNAFKAVNDEHGHAVGDRVLKAVAAALTSAAARHARATVGRIGGDEFCVVLPGVDEAAASALVEQAAANLRTSEPDVSIAGGVALGAAGSRPQELFMAADAAQYVAKRQHKVVVSDRVRPAPQPPALGRRRHRDSGTDTDWPRLLSGLTEALAALPADAGVGDRLQAVGALVTHELDLSRWVVSREDGGGLMRALRMRVHRARVSAAQGSADEEVTVCRLDDYPATAAVLRDGGTFFADAATGEGDEAERAWLTSLGLRAVLGVGVPAPDGGWLLELLADGDSRLADVAPLLALVTAFGTRPD